MGQVSLNKPNMQPRKSKIMKEKKDAKNKNANNSMVLASFIRLIKYLVYTSNNQHKTAISIPHKHTIFVFMQAL